VSAFLFHVSCLQCGGPLTPVSQASVHPIEAFVRVACTACRAGATLRVIYANRNDHVPEIRGIDP
jgi:hypothetical protein